VEVYSPGKTAELFLGGRSLGRQSVEGFKAVFETVYEPGTLRAVSYDENGDEISADEIRTYGMPARLRIMSECGDTLPANGESLCYAVVEITDADGNYIPWAEDELTVEYIGEGTLIAFGSARPTTEENYTARATTAYKGRALAVIRASAAKGQARLRVRSKRFGETEMEIHFL
jgi:beta-galactosidase